MWIHLAQNYSCDTRGCGARLVVRGRAWLEPTGIVLCPECHERRQEQPVEVLPEKLREKKHEKARRRWEHDNGNQ